MLYSNKKIIVSDLLGEEGALELGDFMNTHSIRRELYTEYLNSKGESISEPFINIYPTIYRYSVLTSVTYITEREMLTLLCNKNESKEKAGYPATRILTIP